MNTEKNLPDAQIVRTISLEALAVLYAAEPPIAEELEALRRLLEIAHSDTGQSRRVANFLLAWWNAVSCGGFDLTDLWAVDTAIAKDMLTVSGLIARVREYPDALGFGGDFRQLVADWRPELDKDSDNG